MEMLEEGQNQHKIGPKRIKFEEVEEKGEVDRLSALPDCLLVEILSRLPLTEYAFSTCILSKRWKHLWTLTPTLIFRYRGSCFPRFEFYSFVDKALTQRPQSKLKKLQVNTGYHIQYESQVNNWIRYAISCNVEELILKLYTDFECHLDQFLYISSCLTNLTLQGCILNPIVAISWKNLRSLSISYAKLDEDLIENILCGSPLLETLELGDCYGYRLLNITSKSLKKLVFSGYYDPEDQCDDLCDIIEIIAPNILSLTIRDTVLLWKLLLVNVSSLVEAELDYEKRGHYETTRKEAQEEMLKGFIINLVHVKELKIGNWCKMVLSRLEAKGFVSPSNVKFPDDSYDWSDSDSD